MRFIYLLVWFLATLPCRAQAPFTATWPFEGGPGGSASHSNVGTGGADFVGVAPSNFGPYVAGQSGQAVNVANWSQTGGCNVGEFVQVTVQPLNGQRLTLISLSFFFNRSPSGPQEIRVRSSIDNFGNDIHQQGTADGFQQANVGLGGAYANLTGPVTFRIYACPPNGGGTLRLDQLVIAGSVTTAPLPVDLLYFRAQPQGNRVALSWATAWERNADRFVIQRSRDLGEFVALATVAATGNSDARQLYTFTDDWPDAGISYYRLQQIDRDGTTQLSKPVSVVLDDSTPALALLENPTTGEGIQVVTRNLDGTTFQLITLTGQVMPLQADARPDGSLWLRPGRALSAGLYLLRAGPLAVRVLVGW